ncbi:MAG: hypothetical protein LBQ06_06835 [Frankiaceae bacterium]|jgi:uncharacterized protein YukE|nr:hypothetical protein [Frankiaceae bacterium]
MNAPAAQQYRNELEIQFARLPGWLQSPLQAPFQTVDDLLHQVAGDPADLLRAGQVYAALGPRIEQVGADLTNEATAIGPDWQADSYQAFLAKIKDIEQRIAALGQATAQTEQILQAGADAAVQGANAIIDIVVSVIEFIIADIVINVALSVVTFGATLAAGIAEALADVAIALARILKIVDKVAEVLVKIAEILQKIAELLRTLAEVLKGIKAVLEEIKIVLKNAKELGLGKLGQFALRGLKAGLQTGVRGAGNAVLPGAPITPGKVGVGRELFNDLNAERTAVENDIQQAEANR